MPRHAQGQLYENRSKRTGRITSFGVRFRHGGKRHYVGLMAMTRKEADIEMADLMADVRRGIWVAPELRAPEPEARVVPTFAEFASEWFHGRVADGLGEKGQKDVLWRLGHLRNLGPLRLNEITVERVDQYRRAKVKEGAISAGSINKTISTLAAVLEVACEYEHIARNPAKGKRRKLKAQKPARIYLDRTEHIVALLDAAGALDSEESRRSLPWRRAMLATLTFAGLRISEALALRWRDVDLAGGAIHVRGTKTEAADRRVELLAVLRDELAVYAAACGTRDPNGLVFVTKATGRGEGGRAHSQSNVRSRVLCPAIEIANESLEKRGTAPIPGGLTLHGLRRTYASILVALGRDPAYFMGQMGHTTASMTLEVYAKAMASGEGERDRLRALVDGAKWQEMGNTEDAARSEAAYEAVPVDAETAQ